MPRGAEPRAMRAARFSVTCGRSEFARAERRALDVEVSDRRAEGQDRPMGDEPRWLDGFLTRLCLMRWLSPDAELEGLGDGAMAWLGERVDEFFAALGYSDADPPPPWRVVSFLDDASRAANLPRITSRVGEYSPAAMALVAKLSIAWFEALFALSKRVSAEARARVALDVWRVLDDHARSCEGPGARRGGALAVGLPGGNAAVMHAIWLLAYGRDAASPWAPLLALWERGACTLVTPEGELVVYVPRRVRTENGITLALNAPSLPGSRFDSEITDEDLRRRRYPQTHQVTWCTVTAEFSRHGLGPMPGMYEPMSEHEAPPDRIGYPPRVPYVVLAPSPLDLGQVINALHLWERPTPPASPLTSAFPHWNTDRWKSSAAPAKTPAPPWPDPPRARFKK